LNVKDPGAPRWASGKDGDLRDVWREVQNGGKEGGDGKTVPKGLIMSVFGKQEVVEHDVDEMSEEIGIIGRAFKERGSKKVAVYLPNSVEFLMTIFGESYNEPCLWRMANCKQHAHFTASRLFFCRTTFLIPRCMSC
jgi:hypothetical protein